MFRERPRCAISSTMIIIGTRLCILSQSSRVRVAAHCRCSLRSYLCAYREGLARLPVTLYVVAGWRLAGWIFTMIGQDPSISNVAQLDALPLSRPCNYTPDRHFALDPPSGGRAKRRAALRTWSCTRCSRCVWRDRREERGGMDLNRSQHHSRNELCTN